MSSSSPHSRVHRSGLNSPTNASQASSCPVYNPYVYPCNSGLLLPVINEHLWPTGARGFLYLLGLLWCFLAVAIVADIFMCAIERITSKTRIVRLPDSAATRGYREVEVKVWNDTVANLSLLALGTSAPEILLSVIEICGNRFVAGELGPGTIVGSAAFNLLVISAICMVAIPAGDTRRVASVKVFAVTACSGVLAYVWVAVVLLAVSPHRVELWEAALTFAFFPLLILLAYLADKDFFMGTQKPEHHAANKPASEAATRLEDSHKKLDDFIKKPDDFNEKPDDPKRTTEDSQKTPADVNWVSIGVGGRSGDEVHSADSSSEEENEILHLSKEMGRVQHLSPEEAAKLVASRIQTTKEHDRGFYRINALRALTGGRKLIPKVPASLLRLRKGQASRSSHQLHMPVVEFTAAEVAVMENVGTARVGVRRHGKLDCCVSVRVVTANGTAEAGEDFEHLDQVIKFEKNETLKAVQIQIVDDVEWEPDEVFFVKLHLEPRARALLGDLSVCQVIIINDDEPGVLAFTKPGHIIKETGLRALIPVARTGGADSHVSVRWRTKDVTAVNGRDYQGGEGQLTFHNQETSKSIEIALFRTYKIERDDSFQVELFEPGGGASLGKLTKCIVTILNDDDYTGLVTRIFNLTKANLDTLSLERASYAKQFYEAMNVNGGDLESASFLDYVMHFLTFLWKILFAFIPPPHYLGGWPAFVVSLAVIGLLTAVIGDLASIFGCLIGLKDGVTAITLVALGTSMPDTFASKQAAVLEKTADSSVGNVNGSNSVNVFLGLGLPWLIACVYWRVTSGQDFEVPAGDLGFSVLLFTGCALLAIGLLVARRLTVGAELGGPVLCKYLCAGLMVLLWLFYVLMSALQTYSVIHVHIG